MGLDKFRWKVEISYPPHPEPDLGSGVARVRVVCDRMWRRGLVRRQFVGVGANYGFGDRSCVRIAVRERLNGWVVGEVWGG